MNPIEKEMAILISAKYPIVYIVSREEDRVIESLKKVAGKLFKSIYSWNCVNGLSYKNKKYYKKGFGKKIGL
jgi:hypothetical protein